MITDKEKQLLESLQEKEYRDELAVEHVNTTLAVQIRKIREAHNWSQTELAEYLGKHQETISQWENPDYGRHSLSTLKNLASIFDVALMVRFTSFSELVHDMDNLSNERLAPPSYQEDVMNQSTDWSSQLSGVLDRAEDYDAYHNSIGTEGLSSFQSWYFSNNSGSVVLFPIDNLKRKAVNNVA